MSFLTKLPFDRYDPDAFKQFTGGTEFDIGDARAMAWMSQLAYETDEPGKIADILKLQGLALVEDGVVVEESKTVLPLASTHCFVASHPKAVRFPAPIRFRSPTGLRTSTCICRRPARPKVTRSRLM